MPAAARLVTRDWRRRGISSHSTTVGFDSRAAEGVTRKVCNLARRVNLTCHEYLARKLVNLALKSIVFFCQWLIMNWSTPSQAGFSACSVAYCTCHSDSLRTGRAVPLPGHGRIDGRARCSP